MGHGFRALTKKFPSPGVWQVPHGLVERWRGRSAYLSRGEALMALESTLPKDFPTDLFKSLCISCPLRVQSRTPTRTFSSLHQDKATRFC